MDGIIAIGKAKKDIASALTGVASMVVGTDKQSIVVTTNDGATFRLNIPNPVDDADLINRISVNSEGNVCLDGEELAWKEDIPVKVSELDNDENFVKLEELNEKLKQIVTGGTGGSVDGYTKGEVNTLLNKKLDKPETDGTEGQVLTVQADGTNAYADIPTYDDTELRELIGDIPIGNLSYEIVETLPEVTSDEAKEHTLYMIKSGSDDTGYNQYIIVDGAYKKVGSTTGGAITGGAIIDDNTVSTITVFSSNKISTEYAKIDTIPVLTDIIDDTQTLTNKTNSSSKILTDIQKCLEDSKTYTLEELEKVKIDNTLTTTDKTIVGAINEISSTQLDTVGFSADYKNIILNRKSGLNPYTIPIASIINNISLTELKDIDGTDIGNGKTIVYNSVTQKHKYVNATLTDELVKMDSTTDAHYLADLIDKSTIVNEDGILKVKMLDGQDVTIAEINHLKGLTMNIMDLVNSFANGGVKVLNTPVATYADLTTLDRSTFVEGISYIVYVLADETHAGEKTTYLCDKTSSTYFGNADSQRNFTTNPIDLANEVTGKLDNSHIDIDSLWTLLTINDTYKTLTTKNEVFGTHGAKALYDELVTYIGEKANISDLTTHAKDTGIHITSVERTKWNKVDNKVNKTDITTTIDSSSTDEQVASAKAVYDGLESINDFSVQVVQENLDLNNIIETGIYFFPQAYTPVNIPVGVNGWLLVMKGSSSDIVKQVWYRQGTANANSYNTFERYKAGDTWGDWTRFLTEKDYYSALNIGNTNILENDDLNNYLTPGVYTCMSSTIANTLANCPHIGSNFKLIVNKNRGNNDTFYGYQMIVGTKGGNPVTDVCVYYRGISMYDNAYVFSKWKIMSGSTVEDVPFTTITTSNLFSNKITAGAVNYCVKNGVCYVYLDGIRCSEVSTNVSILENMPKALITSGAHAGKSSSDATFTQYCFIVKNETTLKLHCFKANDTGYCSFSYPVAE